MALATPLDELHYSQVQFEPGPVQSQARENHQLVLNLDEDALLRPFRQRAGLPAPGHDLGGWYDTYAFAPGATFGQWICALARYYAAGAGEPARAKVLRLVRAYAATVDAGGKFYRDNRFPAYIYDKLAGGLIDAKRYAADDSAVAVLQKTTQAAIPYLPPHAMPRNEHAQPGEDFSEHAWDESYTLPENQFFAAQLTGDGIHVELARRFLYDDFFLALARGENALPGKHAYSHVNALSSAAQAYLALGQRTYFDAARQGFDFIDAQSFATGGWGPDEHFVVPGSGGLATSLANEHKSFETPCGAYAHFKLTRYLLRITRDSRYGDSMERVLYNCALGARPIQPDGRAFYYSDYNTLGKQVFPPRPLAVLLRHPADVGGRLRHQRLFHRSARHLCESVRSRAHRLAPGRGRLPLVDRDRVPLPKHGHPGPATLAAADVCAASAHPGVGRGRECRGQWQAQPCANRTGNIRRSFARLALRRPDRTGFASQPAAAGSRRRTPRHGGSVRRPTGADATPRRRRREGSASSADRAVVRQTVSR